MGSPTILLEAGDESDVNDWRLVMPGLANHTHMRVRPGGSRGEAPTRQAAVAWTTSWATSRRCSTRSTATTTPSSSPCWDNRAQIGDFPLAVISNDHGENAPPGDEQTNVADQQGWPVLSPSSKQVVVTSGHDVPVNEPELVVREILAVLNATPSS